jgi:hypothetical protein
MTKAKKIANPWETVSAAKTAEFFGISVRTLTSWTARDCPKNSYGKYNLQEVMKWRGSASTSESSEAKKAKAEAKYREHKAELAELQVGEKAGNLISKEEVINEWALRVANVKTSLLLLPKKLAGLFPDPRMRQQVEEVVKDVVRNALDQYVRKGDYTPDEKDFPKIEAPASESPAG